VAPAARAFAHLAPGLDLLYGTFESRMRGSTEEILGRQRADHLGRLVALPHPELPVVDLGCGRGELVGLLEAEGQAALGVDANAAQLLEAGAGTFEEADLFDWLDGREDGTVRAVVALHVVEHLPADLQVRLVHEARRVLAPGGMLLLETPNITSLAVGASTFWVDPTHLRPVHPEFLRFLVEDAGFSDVRTELLHPGPLELTGPPGAEGLVGDLNGLLLGPSDLALVATQPGPG
jgi:O-antigen chain-terminating methyltransferase